MGIDFTNLNYFKFIIDFLFKYTSLCNLVSQLLYYFFARFAFRKILQVDVYSQWQNLIVDFVNGSWCFFILTLYSFFSTSMFVNRQRLFNKILISWFVTSSFNSYASANLIYLFIYLYHSEYIYAQAIFVCMLIIGSSFPKSGEAAIIIVITSGVFKKLAVMLWNQWKLLDDQCNYALNIRANVKPIFYQYTDWNF